MTRRHSHGRAYRAGMPRRLVRWLPAALAPVVLAAVVAGPALAATAPPSLPGMSAKQVLELTAKAKDVRGFSGTVQQRSELGLPELPSTGAGTDSETASALDLLTGDHDARVWSAGEGKSRVAILDATAERDVVANGRSVWLWDSKANTAEHVTFAGSTPARPSTPASVSTPAEAAEALLAKADSTTAITVGDPQRVAKRDAYTLVLTPKTSATTVGSVRIAVDAATGMPLDVQVIARGASSPAFETAFTAISYSVPAASTFVFAPPSDAKVTSKTIIAPTEKPTHASGSMDAARKPTVTGSDWSAIVEVPAADVPSDITANATVQRLTTATSAGRVLRTALVNVLLTTDGRVLAGAVPVSSLVAAAG